MILKELLTGVDVIEKNCNENIDVKGIEYDSRKIKPGEMFICIKGFNTDGHLFIDDAVKKGATVVVIEEDVNVSGINVVKVRDSRKAMARIASNFYGAPSKKLILIGVTGTNGKTTVTNLIWWILKEAGQKVGLIGTINTIIGNEQIPSSRTTPESVDLQRIFREMVDKGVKYAVMEVSSHSLALHRVDQCDFDVAVFTNLTRDHLDFHRTMEEYMNAKLKLFKMTKASIINIDDEYGSIFAKDANKPVITYGIDKTADVMAKNMAIKDSVTEFDLCIDNRAAHIKYSVPGKFSIYNALAAISVLHLMGYDLNKITTYVNNFKGVKGRCELLECNKPFKVIIDYAHTPDGLENILKAAREFTRGRLICVFGCGGDRDKSKRPIMGKIAVNLADYSIITSDNPRSEEPMSIIRDIIAGIEDNSNKYTAICDRKEAIRHAMEMARVGDVILLAGKGHETYQIFKDKTIEFDERKIVKEILLEEKHV